MENFDYETSEEFEEIYQELSSEESGYRFKIYKIIEGQLDKNSESKQLVDMVERIEKLTNIEKKRINELLEGGCNLTKNLLGNPEFHFNSYEEEQYYEEDLLSLQIIETSIKSKIERVRRIHLDLGKDLEEARELFRSMGYDDREETFSKWYTNMGLSPDAVSHATKRYKLFLKYKDSIEDDARSFFESISVRFIKQLTKQDVVNSGLQKELLMKIHRGELKVSTEINEILKEKKLIEPNFSGKKLYMLAGKIDRYKSQIKKDDLQAYRDFMFTLVQLDNFCDIYAKKNSWNSKTLNPLKEMNDYTSKIRERNLKNEDQEKIQEKMNEIEKILKKYEKREKVTIIDVTPEVVEERLKINKKRKRRKLAST